MAEAAEVEILSKNQVYWHHLLQAENDNLRTAISWSSESDQAEIALRIIGALVWFWFRNGSNREARDLALKALDSPSAVAFPHARARALNTAGIFLCLLGETVAARQALQEAFFGIESDLRWYRKRLPEGSAGSSYLAELCSVWVRLLAPVIPFSCEYLWKRLGKSDLVSFAPWPVEDPAAIDRRLELFEELLLRTVEDIESIVKIIQMAPSAITIYTAPEWKRRVFLSVAGAENKATVIREIMKDEEMRKRGREVTDTVRQCTMLIHRLPPHIGAQLLEEIPDEQSIFQKSAGFLQKGWTWPTAPSGPVTW